MIKSFCVPRKTHQAGVNCLMLFLILAPLWAAAAGASETDCQTLADWMTGSFSSATQAAADSSYFDIRLEMARIWTERGDGYWFYVEQAVAGNTDRPYRQRVYRVAHVEDDLFRSEVFLLPDPDCHVGEWRKEEPLHGLSPDDLEVRSGCTVFLRLDVWGRFAGGTVGRGCTSALRGAAYATSEVVVGPGRIESWDRGLDESGRQVWGAETGPYIFIRHSGPAVHADIHPEAGRGRRPRP